MAREGTHYICKYAKSDLTQADLLDHLHREIWTGSEFAPTRFDFEESDDATE